MAKSQHGELALVTGGQGPWSGLLSSWKRAIQGCFEARRADPDEAPHEPIRHMSRKKTSQKPIHRLGSLVFAKSGKVTSNVEDLPRGAKERELAIGQKFVGALEQFHGQTISDLSLGEEPGDLTGRTSKGVRISIQVVEVVDQAMRKVRSQRDSYTARLLEQASDR